MTAMCGMLTLSCSEEVINNTVPELVDGMGAGPSTGSGTVKIGTRGDTSTPFQTRLYYLPPTTTSNS